MIKNLIFDFGDIFINLDKGATHSALAKFGVLNIDADAMQVVHQYEEGKISTTAFVTFFSKKYAVPKKDLITAWNAILLDFPLHRLSFVKALADSKKYRLFLLSNTNDLHITWIQNNWGKELYATFKNCFEQFYLSHEISFRKPNAETYQFVLKENNLKASETFFIDDTKENTDAAEKLGIKTWNLMPGKEDVVDLQTKKELNP
ncbi:MAG: HAD family phosphatase [Polaribacter sp.]|nr:HAD family phosphatase [Polaribacter sp.]MDG1811453.1 HAD family phosphatase [Polaribacter sp.]MDG1994581.1 HAD family phosphatase [Polaribacter sp.]